MAEINLKIIAELVDKVSPGLTKLSTSLKSIGTSVTGFSKNQTKNFEALSASIQKTNEAAKKAAASTAATGAAHRQAGHDAEGLNGILGNSKVRYEGLVMAHELVQGSFKKLASSSMVMMENLNLSAKAILALSAIGGLTVAFIHHIDAVNDMANAYGTLNKIFEVTGRTSQLSNKQIASSINELRNLVGVSKQDAMDIITTFARIPTLAGPQIQQLTKLVVAFSEVTGKDAVASARELGEAIARPVEGAKKLDDMLNILTTSEKHNIEQLVRLGKTSEAQAILLAKLQGSLGDLHQKGLTPLDRALEDLYKTWFKLKGGISGPETEASWSNGAKIIQSFTKTIEELNAQITRFGTLRGILQQGVSNLPAFGPFALLKGVVGAGSAAGTIPGDPSGKAPVQQKSSVLTTALLKETAEQKALKDEINKKSAAERLNIDTILEANSAYKTQAQLVKENRERLVALNKVLASPYATAKDKELARVAIAGINEQMVKQKGLLDELAVQQERLAQAKLEEAGFTDKLTASEKILIDIQQGRYNRYPEQVKRLKALAQETVELEKQNKVVADLREVMKGLASLDEEANLRSDRTISQLDAINTKILERTKGSQDPGVKQFAEMVRQDMIKSQVAVNNENLTKTQQSLTRSVEEQILAIDTQNQKYTLTSNQLRELNEQEQVRLKYDQAIVALSPTLVNYEQQKAQLLKDQSDALKLLGQKQAERLKFEADWTNGAKKALNEVKEASMNVADITYTAFKSGFNSISDVFQEFMRTGKITFESLGDSFKRTIDKMIADALAARVMNSLFGNFNTTGQLGGIGGDFTKWVNGIFGGGRAAGGPVESGRAYLVGEHRPEIFVPNTAGTIIPDTSGVTSASNVTIQISALDGSDVMKVLHGKRREIADLVSGSRMAYNMR